MEAALVGEQPGSLLPHQQHQGDGATSCLALWVKLQQHQLYAVSSDSEHRQQPGRSLNVILLKLTCSYTFLLKIFYFYF